MTVVVAFSLFSLFSIIFSSKMLISNLQKKGEQKNEANVIKFLMKKLNEMSDIRDCFGRLKGMHLKYWDLNYAM